MITGDLEHNYARSIQDRDTIDRASRANFLPEINLDELYQENSPNIQHKLSCKTDEDSTKIQFYSLAMPHPILKKGYNKPNLGFYKKTNPQNNIDIKDQPIISKLNDNLNIAINNAMIDRKCSVLENQSNANGDELYNYSPVGLRKIDSHQTALSSNKRYSNGFLAHKLSTYSQQSVKFGNQSYAFESDCNVSKDYLLESNQYSTKCINNYKESKFEIGNIFEDDDKVISTESLFI